MQALSQQGSQERRSYVKSEKEMREDFYTALKFIFTQHPEYARNPLWVTGESYGGKYVPNVAYEIHLRGEFPLKGIIIGNGVYSGLIQNPTVPEFAYNQGLIDEHQWAFCTAGATIVSGGVAERVKSPTYAVYAFFMASFIYPIIVAWSWGGGFLATITSVGYMDFAGSGVVHLTGGVSALAGTVVLGPRKGRFENPEEFECHNLPLVVLGTFALWFGWYGFNPGSTLGMHDGATGALAAQVAMNTTLAAATGGITVFLLRYVITKKYDVGGLCNGILAGLVSITAGCGNVECGSAFAIGLVGAFVYQGSSMLLQKLKIDDPVDASPVHGFCGIWGVLAAGFLDWGKGIDQYHGWSGWGCVTEGTACKTGLGGDAIGAQFALIAMVILWSGSLSTIAFLVLKLTGLLRISEEVEEVGIDEKSHSPAKAYSLSADAKSMSAVVPVQPNSKAAWGEAEVARDRALKCVQLIEAQQLKEAEKFCEDAVRNLYASNTTAGGVFYYDVGLKDASFLDHLTDLLGRYLNSPETRAALHVGNRTWRQADEVGPVAEGLILDFETPQGMRVIESLLDAGKGYRVVTYNGVRDGSVCNHLGNLLSMKALKWYGSGPFNAATTTPWRPLGPLAGYQRSYGPLSYYTMLYTGSLAKQRVPQILNP
ncbi:AMT1-1 [Symbiodinium microadriaticum]|nr:AMT1-1 [Symbiodinium microadriaticum]